MDAGNAGNASFEISLKAYLLIARDKETELMNTHWERWEDDTFFSLSPLTKLHEMVGEVATERSKQVAVSLYDLKIAAQMKLLH